MLAGVRPVYSVRVAAPAYAVIWADSDAACGIAQPNWASGTPYEVTVSTPILSTLWDSEQQRHVNGQK
jgi:hypothetical protein